MTNSAEKLPDPEPEPIPVERPGYTSVNTWALNLISQKYNLPNLLHEVTPWLDESGQLTDRAVELIRSIKVTVEKQQVSVAEIFDSVVSQGYELIKTEQQKARSRGKKVLQFLTGHFPEA